MTPLIVNNFNGLPRGLSSILWDIWKCSRTTFQRWFIRLYTLYFVINTNSRRDYLLVLVRYFTVGSPYLILIRLSWRHSSRIILILILNSRHRRLFWNLKHHRVGTHIICSVVINCSGSLISTVSDSLWTCGLRVNLPLTLYTDYVHLIQLFARLYIFITHRATIVWSFFIKYWMRLSQAALLSGNLRDLSNTSVLTSDLCVGFVIEGLSFIFPAVTNFPHSSLRFLRVFNQTTHWRAHRVFFTSYIHIEGLSIFGYSGGAMGCHISVGHLLQIFKSE